MVRVSDVNHSTKSARTIPPYNAMSASHFYNKQWERPNVSIPTHTHGTIPNRGWQIHHKEWILISTLDHHRSPFFPPHTTPTCLHVTLGERGDCSVLVIRN